MRADTPSSLEGETFGGDLPAQLVLVRCTLAGQNKTYLAGIAGQMRAAKSVAVLDCFPSSGDIVRVALMAKVCARVCVCCWRARACVRAH